MGGHSHWSQVKRQKGVSDVKRGMLFTKLSREITVAAREGGGDAIIVQTFTDNRNRTVSDLRTTLSRGGGSLGESGSVAWQFESRGFIALEVGEADPEEVALAAIDAGVDDVRVEGRLVEVYTAPTELEKVRRQLQEAGLTLASPEL